MTIKHHIAILATISLTLIAVIACQQKPQASNEEKGLNDKIKTQITKIEDMENAANVKVEAKKIEDKAQAAETKSNEGIKEIENKIYENTEKVESEVNDIGNKIEDAAESKEEQGPRNLLANSDFSEGLSNWRQDGNILLIQNNNENYIEIEGSNNRQSRIIQSILTVSGHVYRLSYKFKGKNEKAFAIIRDENAKTERYLFSNPSDDWKLYTKDFISFKDGFYTLYLSCIGEGKFYYSSVSFIDKSE